MGCGASARNRMINIHVEPCGIEEVDSLSSEVQFTFKEVKRIHRKLKFEIEQFQELTFTRLLENSLIENSVYVMLLTLSAATKGQFERLDLKITSYPSYISFSKDSLSNELKKLARSWEILVAATIELPTQLVFLQEQVRALSGRLNRYMDSTVGIISEHELNPIQTVKVVKSMNGTVQKLNSISCQIEMIEEKLKTLTKQFTSLEKKYSAQGKLEQMRAIGVKAYKDGYFDPQQLLVVYLINCNNQDLKNYLMCARGYLAGLSLLGTFVP